MLCFSSVQGIASWYTDNAQQFFKVSFNATIGTLHVESFAHHGSYFGCCGVDNTTQLTATSVTYYYTTDNINYYPFYSYGYNYSVLNSENTYGNTISAYAQVVDTKNRVRFVDLYLNNNYRNIKGVKMEIRLERGGGAQGGPENSTDSKTVTITQMSTVSTPTYSFVTVLNGTTYEAKARVSYSKGILNEVDNQSTMALYDASNNTKLSGDLTIGTSGSADVAVSSAPKDYYYRQSAYNGRITSNSSSVTVPAFTFPKTATATYDAVAQKVNLSWTIDPVTSSSVITDKFKIQIADNPEFTDAREVSMDYDPTKSSFTYAVTNNLSPQMHFRVARAHPGFNWELAIKANVAVTFSSLPSTATAVLQNNAALITWNPLASAWLPGATFVIFRYNNTSNTQSEIRLNKSDFDKGTYTDRQVSICNSYSYSLQVVPSVASSFTAFAPVQATGNVLPLQIGTLVRLEVSKGYFPDRTELRWSSIGAFDNFIIKRALYGSNDFVQVASVPGSANPDYQADDTKGSPGVYYSYQVIGVVKCNNTSIFSNETLAGIGFRSPTGNIYGRITYDNGQAVEDVTVRLQSNSPVQLGKSIYLNGTANSYLQLDSTTAPFSDSSFTVEAWIKPDAASPVNQVIFSRNNQYVLGFNGSGQLYFSFRGFTATGIYSNPLNAFVHITGIHTKDSLFIMLNNAVIARMLAPNSTSTPDKVVYVGRGSSNQLFKGFIDEVRVYDIAVDFATIVKYQHRLFTGDESGLAAYWRFDESITNAFYDLSFHGENYNRNDGKMNSAAVVRSNNIPTANQLSFNSFTDVSGNYFIAGIPYIGNGTTYTIVPLKGTHKFDPVSVNRLISPSSTQFTVDFKDKSSFPVSGYVYYKNTTVPVPGVQFKIDGQYAQESNSSIIETDENGFFDIAVPVGVHEVKAVKANHIFENDGKMTDKDGNNRNYQDITSGVELTDLTTIRFIGRVAGGAIQQDHPLGHSVSRNNLGKSLNITLELTVGNKHELNRTAPSTVVTTKHLLPANISDSSKIHKTLINFKTYSVVITPDPVTGEFIADLIPVKYITKSVDVTGWGDLLGGKPVLLDFTDRFAISGSVRRFEDSALNSQNTYVKKKYFDSLSYNASYKFIKRVGPSIEILQKDDTNKSLPYFGNLTYETASLVGVTDNIALVDTNKTGKAIYNFGNPVFVQSQLYNFSLKAFEKYPFYEGVVNDIPVIKNVGGIDVTENVPTSDGFVTVLNNIRTGAATPDTFSLNSMGMATYQFVAGDPSISTGIKDFAASINFGEAVNVSWKWYGDPQLQVYVMGGKLTGTDFITAGPDKVLMVLRDPPGSKSFSYADKGSTITNSSVYGGSVDQVGDLDLTQKLGAEVVTWKGFLAGTINTVKATTSATVGIRHEEHFSNSNTKETVTTLTTRFQTSPDPLFVGHDADVFVGYSTNIAYGKSNNVTIIKRADLKNTDVLIYPLSGNSTYVLIKRNGINIGETFGTLFAFPKQHLERVLIPNLIEIRNIALLPKGTSSTDAQAMANTAKKAIYVSKLPNGDANFGKSNNDTIAFGITAKNDPFGNGKSYQIFFPITSDYRTDTIMILNQYVANWQKRMADNEKAKLQSTLIQNYSFQAGSPITYTDVRSVKQTAENAFNFIIAASVTDSKTLELDGSGFVFKYKESIGTNVKVGVTNSNLNAVTLGFSLASNGTDDYFSVDLKNAPDNSQVFITKGGVSACPYVPATISKYYQPGSVIEQPTQRIEVPVITVDNPVVSDIPSSRKATYSITLRNESEAKLPATFTIRYTENDSIKGAAIAVDGTSIAAGRTILLPYGESITKVLTLTKGSAMDYNNIQILLTSACQYNPIGYRETIADTVLISAHFIPSCSDISIKSPKDKWVLNSESPVNAQGKRYIRIIIDQFDITNSLFDHIELQYKPTTSSTWITGIKFYSDPTKLAAAQGEKQLITNAAAINYSFVLDDGSFNDQNYEIQAVSFCKVGADYVTTESNLISGIKDTYNPRLFGTPQPADGVLNVNDDVRLNFNETIAAGLLTNSDFQVTGIRNGVKGDHTVSVRLDGVGNYLATEFEKSFTGKNITAEMWILPSRQANQTLFSHGDQAESLELALTTDNKIQVTAGGSVIISAAPYNYRPNEWAHVALVYNDKSRTVSAFYNFIEIIHAAAVSPYNGMGHIEYGRSIKKANSYFSGKMHEARIWSDTLNSIKLQINSLSMLSGAENGLIAYYPMSEGKGVVAFDKAHGAHAALNGLWSTPEGKSINLAGNSFVKLNTSFAPVLAGMDYTMEMWFKGDAAQANTTLASNGKGDGLEFDGSLNLFSLGFEGGLLTYWNNAFKAQATGNYLDNKWHHVAVTVNRSSGSAQMLVDAVLNQFFDAVNLGGITAATTVLGARTWYSNDAPNVPKYDRYFTGNIDEFRLWNTYLNQTLVSRTNNVRLMGNELGLMAYYPFETYEIFQGVPGLYFSLKDAKVQEVANTFVPDAIAPAIAASNEAAPMKDAGPVGNFRFDFVVNNDALIINVQEPHQSIDKTIITFKSKNVRDMNGNKILSPITWTAYIDKNQLKWSDREINLVKNANTPMKFESRLVNSGGTAQRFVLSNLPTWLKADKLTGTVDPLGNLKITFTINEGLNIGNYEEIIFMRNDNNETEALKLTLQVKGKKPDWIVKASDYQYDMGVYGKIRLNNLFSINKEDMLAAFIDGKCAGVANNTYNPTNNLWYAFLTVYSNTVTSTNVEYRLWQASTGKTFKATPSLVINFANNGIVGTPALPIIFDGSASLYQDMVVNENWNWVSFNLAIPTATPITTTLLNGNFTSVDLIKHDLLGFSNYTTGGWVGSLKSLDNLSLYKLKATYAQSLTLSGSPVNVATTSIPLKGARWNYISYLPQLNATVKEALAGYAAGDEDVIKSQTGFAMYSTQAGWVGSLSILEPGKGYMLFRKTATDVSFRYPTITGNLGGSTTPRGILPNPNQRPVPGNYSNADNMTIVAVVAPGVKFTKDDSIVAYVNGELRGKAKPILNPEIDKHTYFFNIGGQAEQSIVFTIERGGTTIAQSSTIVGYSNNTVIGSLKKPLELQFVKTANTITVYPNPFTNGTNIRVDLGGSAVSTTHEIQVSVYDVAGRVIMRKPVQKVTGTGFITTWNGRNAAGLLTSKGVYLVHVLVDGVPNLYKVIKQ